MTDANTPSPQPNNNPANGAPPRIRLSPPSRSNASLPRPRIKLKSPDAPHALSTDTVSNPKKDTTRVDLPSPQEQTLFGNRFGSPH